MKCRYAFIPALIFALAGCETPVTDAMQDKNREMEAKGSPFRYTARDDTTAVMTLLPLPAGPTKAVPPLAQQALEAITTEEMRKGRTVTKLEEVRYLKDGREVWVLHTLGEGIAYIVAFASPSQPGTDIRIEGPNTYKK